MDRVRNTFKCIDVAIRNKALKIFLARKLLMEVDQEGFIEEVTRLSQCLNAKTGFVHF